MLDNKIEGWEEKMMRESPDSTKNKYLPENAIGFENFYFIQEMHKPEEWSNRMYRDGNISLTLYREISGAAEALVGFKKISPETIMVVQLQARKGIQKDSLPKKLEKTLLEAGINYAREQGYSQIQVLPSKRNNWRRKDTNGKDHNKRLKMRYDVTAKRSGFKLDEEADAWALDL